MRSGVDEITAAAKFIHGVEAGSWTTPYYESRHLDHPVAVPEAGEDWRKWFLKEAAATTLQGANLLKMHYSMVLQGADWAITLTDVASGDVNLFDVLQLARLVLPLARATSLKVIGTNDQ